MITCTCMRTDEYKEVSVADSIQCAGCGRNFHLSCVGLRIRDKRFRCVACAKDGPMFRTKSTLIVSPESIAHQWYQEIMRHTAPGALNVRFYKGAKAEGPLSSLIFLEYDIVITTYKVLRSELVYANAAYVERKSLRRPKVYEPQTSPLIFTKYVVLFLLMRIYIYIYI